MNAPTIGSLFTGYGGLDQAVAAVTGGETVWVSDIDKGANKILAHRYPNVPNLGDITRIDWTQVEPVDMLTGGFPCQDLSHAGKRAGLSDGTRSGLWSYMADAIEALNPRLVVIENVRGLLSAQSPGVVEPCPWCVGDEPVSDLRALGTVLADLADIGYDAKWCGLRAADVGACHGRFRIFLTAYPREDSEQLRRTEGRFPASVQTSGGGASTVSSGSDGMDARTVSSLSDRDSVADTESGGAGGQPIREAAQLTKFGSHINRPNDGVSCLLPTPVVNDMGAGKTPSEWSEWSKEMRVRHGNGNGHGLSLSIELRSLPTPTTRDHKDHMVRREPHRPESVDTLSRALTQFGEYAPAVARWETVTRPAPPPTEPTGRNKTHQLSAPFVEWMMGLPEGWVTDTPGLTRNEALKALGNGVVPQQAEAALHHLLGEPA